MDLKLSAEDESFAEEVRAFLSEHLTDGLRLAEARSVGTFCDIDAMAQWHECLHRKGWVAPSWPKEHGGTEWSVVQRFIFARECARAGVPRTFTFGLSMCGPVLMRYGNAEQKNYFLPRILSGEHRWCQGYSEPGAGSDLASLQTRAERDGDDYVVNGTKIWTTFAHHANWIFCLVRTDPSAKAQKGISFLLIDLRTPGISMRPIINLAGDHEFNQVFFDDVRVPEKNRVGPENEGWSVAKYLLEFERGEQYAPRVGAMLEQAKRLAVSEGAFDARFAAKLSQAEIETLGLEVTEHRLMSALSRGESIGAMASLLKLRGSELVQRAGELLLEALGFYTQPDQLRTSFARNDSHTIGPDEGYAVTARYLYDRSITIYGGTSEIQRNILARAVLGL